MSARRSTRGLRLLWIALLAILASTAAPRGFAAPIGDPDAALGAANAAWLEGDWEAAADGYGELIAAGYVTGDLYYDLGNALYRQGALDRAILAWRRAADLSRRDGDVQANLDRARAQTVDALRAEGPSGWMFWRQSLNRVEQAWGAALCLGALWALAAVARLRPGAPVGIPATLVGLPGLALAIGVAAELAALETAPDAVVMGDVVAARSTAGDGGVVLFELHAGAEVQIQDRLGDYFQVALPDGRRGWLPNGSLGVVDPRRPLPWSGPPGEH